jgi:hypothetical protein
MHTHTHTQILEGKPIEEGHLEDWEEAERIILKPILGKRF